MLRPAPCRGGRAAAGCAGGVQLLHVRLQLLHVRLQLLHVRLYLLLVPHMHLLLPRLQLLRIRQQLLLRRLKLLHVRQQLLLPCLKLLMKLLLRRLKLLHVRQQLLLPRLQGLQGRHHRLKGSLQLCLSLILKVLHNRTGPCGCCHDASPREPARTCSVGYMLTAVYGDKRSEKN